MFTAKLLTGEKVDCSQSRGNQDEMLTMIRQFVSSASGLRGTDVGPAVRVEQKIDGKGLSISGTDLEEVLFRSDADGQSFIQVNFRSGFKILITDTLIGFKPAQLTGLDMTKIPKVVTTPDIMSVFEALQEAIYTGDPKDDDVSVLRRVFDSVITGGEAVGFDLKLERTWLGRIPHVGTKAAA